MNFFDRSKIFAPIVLRIGFSLVFIWFGFQQLAHTEMWLGLIPKWVTGVTGLQAVTLVHFNGSFEIVFGLCLFFGFFTRVASFLLALHMIHIFATLLMQQGLSAIAIRDFGLSVTATSLFLYGDESFSVDNWLRTRNTQNNSQM